MLNNIILNEEDYSLLSEFYNNLRNINRLKILVLLMNKEMSVNEIASTLKLDQSNTSQQLKLLKLTGLIVSSKKGKQIIYSLKDDCAKKIISATITHLKEDDYDK